MNKDILPVLDEISAVLKKHDMTGLIIVGNQTHCDWRMEVGASWSCATIDGTKLRVRCKREDYPSREAQKIALEATIGNFVTFRDVMVKLDEQVENLLAVIAQSVKFTGKSTEE